MLNRRIHIRHDCLNFAVNGNYLNLFLFGLPADEILVQPCQSNLVDRDVQLAVKGQAGTVIERKLAILGQRKCLCAAVSILETDK